MINLLKDFICGLKVMFVAVLFFGGLFAPMILAVTVSGWFGIGYVITIPLCCASLNYLMEVFN